MKRIAFPIYLLGLSIVLAIASAGYVIYTNRERDRDLVELAFERQKGVNQTLRAMCDRFELRDEIFLRILEQSAERQRALGNIDAVEDLELNILALRLAQGDCTNDIPKVIPPPSVP
jgi:hypothetical protein